MKKIIITTLIFSAMVSCNQQQVDTKSEGEKLMQTSRDWSKAVATRDANKILSYWTDDAVVMSADAPVVKGKEGIRSMVEGSFKNPGFQISWEPERAEISKSGDLGYLMENTKISTKDSLGTAKVQYFNAVTIWKKAADGSWKCVVDVLSPEISLK
ncbi:MAG: DUF4440 domain-containing protein [Chitinophagaceae bacterium]